MNVFNPFSQCRISSNLFSTSFEREGAIELNSKMIRTFQRALSSVPNINHEVAALNSGLKDHAWRMHIENDNYSSLEFDCKFKNFGKTWEFLNEVAILAHTMRHHPSITTTYNMVHLSLTTHDAGNIITYKDLKLALAITDQYCQKAGIKHFKATEQVEELVKTSREQFSFAKANKMIDELLSLKNEKK